MNPLKELEKFGQAPWLDNLSRGLVRSGELAALIERDGIKGVTSNPAIFEKAIGQSTEYDEEIGRLLKGGCSDIGAIFRQLAVADIRAAADALRLVYDATKGADGFVSLEVSPYIANDTDATIAEARELWSEVARDNLMVKVPATPAGLPAIQKLIGEGININITLLFSKAVYIEVAEAYIAGLEALPPDPRFEPRRERGEFLRQPHRFQGGCAVGRKAEGRFRRRTGPSRSPQRARRHRQCEACLSRLRTDVLRAALGSARQTRCAPATAALGLHRHQEQSLFRCALCR